MKIIFSKRPGNLISWLIRKWIKKPYSHTAFSVNLFNTDLIFESSVEGVNVVTINDFLIKNEIVKEYDISELVKKELLMQYLFSNIDGGFSFISFVGIFFKNKTIGMDGEKEMICSEFVARAIGMDAVDLDHVSPKEVEDYILKRFKNE